MSNPPPNDKDDRIRKFIEDLVQPNSKLYAAFFADGVTESEKKAILMGDPYNIIEIDADKMKTLTKNHVKKGLVKIGRGSLTVEYYTLVIL
jgi:hypothetical protein